MNDLLNQVINLFSEKYKPAANIADATEFLDTEEIYTAIKKLAPGTNITAQQVFETLQEEGYKFTSEPGKMTFNLKWMLIKQY